MYFMAEWRIVFGGVKMFGKPRMLKSKPALLFASLLVLFGSALIPANSLAADVATLDEFKALGEKFDHLTTGFALTGEHTQLNCGECHIGGVFEALPRDCESCHDNVIAEGTPSDHIETTRPCDTCHTTQGFIASAIMDHSLVNGTCASCHNGASATGKSVDHINTTNVCEACHSVNLWAPVAADNVNHEHTLGSCVSCHNGVKATGKSASHMPTTDRCDACHLATSGRTWPVADDQVDHGEVLGLCSGCHNNVIARGKGPGHLVTTQECNSCHKPGPAPWTDAIGKPADDLHARVTDVCEACHANGYSAATATVDHGQVLGLCSGCHDGVIATGKGPNHVVTQEECNVCHSPGDPTWAATTP